MNSLFGPPCSGRFDSDLTTLRTSTRTLYVKLNVGVASCGIRKSHTLQSCKYILCLKNVPTLICCNFDIHECILKFFGRNVTDKVSNQKTLYCATQNNLCFCTTWQNGKTRKSHFSLKCSISALTEFNQSLLDFFNLFDSRLILKLLYNSLNLAINMFSCRAVGGMIQEKGSRECCRSWTVLHAQSTTVLSSGFLFCTVMQWGEVGKQSIVRFLTFLVTLLPKIIIIRLCMSKLQQVKGGTFFETHCRTDPRPC